MKLPKIFKKNKNAFEELILVVIFLLLLFAAYIFLVKNSSAIYDYYSQFFSNRINSLGVSFFLIYLFLIILEVVTVVIPGFIFLLGSSIVHPFVAGTIIFLGNIIGASISFWIAKKFGRPIVEKIVTKESLDKMDIYSKKNGFLTLFLLRVNPLTSYDIFNYAAGLTKISFVSFFFATLLGLIPSSYLQAYLANRFLKNKIIFYIFIALVFATVLFIIYHWIRLRRRKRRLLKKGYKKGKH